MGSFFLCSWLDYNLKLGAKLHFSWITLVGILSWQQTELRQWLISGISASTKNDIKQIQIWIVRIFFIEKVFFLKRINFPCLAPSGILHTQFIENFSINPWDLEWTLQSSNCRLTREGGMWRHTEGTVKMEVSLQLCCYSQGTSETPRDSLRLFPQNWENKLLLFKSLHLW